MCVDIIKSWYYTTERIMYKARSCFRIRKLCHRIAWKQFARFLWTGMKKNNTGNWTTFGTNWLIRSLENNFISISRAVGWCLFGKAKRQRVKVCRPPWVRYLLLHDVSTVPFSPRMLNLALVSKLQHGRLFYRYCCSPTTDMFRFGLATWSTLLLSLTTLNQSRVNLLLDSAWCNSRDRAIRFLLPAGQVGVICSWCE